MTLGENKPFANDFHLADVKRPIVVADFSIDYGFLIDLKDKRLLSYDKKAKRLKETNTVLTLAGLSLHHKDSCSD